MGHVRKNNSHGDGRQGIFSGRKSLLFVNKKKQKNFIGPMMERPRSPGCAWGAIQRSEASVAGK
jgi:hypothetical protein